MSNPKKLRAVPYGPRDIHYEPELPLLVLDRDAWNGGGKRACGVFIGFFPKFDRDAVDRFMNMSIFDAALVKLLSLRVD